MILESLKFKNILDLLYHPDIDSDSLNLEISKSDEDHVTIAVNYSDLYYVSCNMNISNEVNHDNYDFNGNLVIPKNGLIKLYQLIGLWPKSTIKIQKINDLVSLDIINHGQLVRERPVYVECFFQQAINNYIIEPPTMRYNCVVNSKNLKQMLEFCNMIGSNGINLEIKEKSLSITSSDLSLATLVELEELVIKSSKKIKLSTEANKLIISFLNKLVNKFNLVYLLFIEEDTAFSIRINFDKYTTIQIYTIHD
jgi:hypothetical protein